MSVATIELPDSARRAWPYAPRFARVNGCRMHYVDEGAGPPVVLLHGNPTWGFLWRDTIPPLLAAGLRVIVPDMIGFGPVGETVAGETVAGETVARACPQPRRPHRQPDRAAARARPAKRDDRLP